MNDLVRTLLLLVLAGAGATALGSAAAWWGDEPRRLRRMLQRALGAPPQMMVMAEGRGLAAGFNHEQGRVAVLWDGGVKGLVYRLDQLIGAELMVDDQVSARAYRGEARRALDQTPSDARRVMLRLEFDNVQAPDFELPLWPPADPNRAQRQTALAAVQTGRRWVSSVEALLRRAPPLPATATQVQARAEAPSPRPRRDDAHLPQPLQDEPPWDDGCDDDDEGAGR